MSAALTDTVATRWEAVIGLEVHVELATRSKIFCGCPTAFGAEPNSQVCPICLGLPGVLPVLNRRALEFAIRAGLALNGRIAEQSKFDRKNYHYPDLPKGYQISQYDQPIMEHGWLAIEVDGREKRIGIRRLHLEEDAGKSIHDAAARGTLVDFNRTGVPLIEIVGEPDLRSPEEARLYLQKLRSILLYTGVSDVKMEEGSLRCDANISLRPAGSSAFGDLVEIKNMNSFRSVQRALEHEVARQAAILDEGGRVVRETRHWDEARGVTVSSRSKEEAHDYRYFPEPDLVPLQIDPAWVESIRASLPELPDARAARYREAYGLPAYDAGVLVDDRPLADFFDAVVAAGANPKAAANWLLSELLGRLHAAGKGLDEVPLTPAGLAELLRLVDDGTISGKIAKTVFETMLETGKSAAAIVEEQGLRQISDEGAILAAVREAIASHPNVVEDYRGGKEKALGFLVGQVMKATRGKANPGLVNDLLRREIG